MPIHHSATFVEDCSTLEGCHLIRFGDSPVFGLACRLNDNPMWVCFEDDGNIRGPLVHDAYGPCVSFGPDFVVGFDPASIILNGDEANRGDLIICSDNLFLVARMGPTASRFGHGVNVNLKTGEVVSHQRNSAVVRQWSIAIDPWQNDQLVPIFERSA